MHRMLTRRDFLRVGGGASLAAMLASCQIKTRSPEAGSPDGGSGGTGKNTLEFWAFDQGRADFARAAAESEAFKSAHPDVQVNFRIFPYEQMHDKLLTALVSGKGAPDIADIEISRFGQFIKGERVPLVGLTDRIGSEIDNVYKPAATDPWTWKGEIYGVGNELNTVVLAYRRDILEQAGIELPLATWDDVISAGHEISTDDRKMFAIHDLSFGDWYMLAQHAGTTLFDANGNYNGDDPLSIEAMQFARDLVYKHQVAGIAPAEANDNWAPPQYMASFRAGRFAATFGPPWHLSFFIDQVPDQAGKWDVQKLPEGLGESRPTANFGGTGQAITEQSTLPDVAFDLIKTANLTTEGVLADFKMRTAYPAYKPAYEDPTLSQPNDYFGGKRIGQLYSEVAPDLPPFRQSPVWPDATQALERDVITPVMQDKKSAKAALTGLRSTIENLNR